MNVVIVVALFFTTIVIFLYAHNKGTEGLQSKIRVLEAAKEKLEKECAKLNGRLADRDGTVEFLKAKVVDLEKENMELLKQVQSEADNPKKSK